MEKPSAQSAHISLKQAAERVPYSAQYLGLRARQGKLKSIKIGRDWFTTEEWLREYAKNVRTYRKKEHLPLSFSKSFYDANARVNPLPDLSRLRPRISPEYHHEAVASSRAMIALLACYAIIVSVFVLSPRNGEYREFTDFITRTLTRHAREQVIPFVNIFASTSEESANLARVLLASSGAAAVEYVSHLSNDFKVP